MTSFANRLLGPPLVFLFVAISLQSAAQETDISASLKRVRQTLVAPPALPDHSQVALGGPTIMWVSQVLGHHDPALTLRTYAHVLERENDDMGFLEPDASIRDRSGTVRDKRSA